MVPTSRPPVEAWGTAVCASVRLTDRNMRRCTAEPSELSRICHCVPDPACAWPFVAASVIACFTAVPSRPSASTLTSCLTEAPGRIGVGSIVCVTPSANFPKHAVARRPAAARSERRRYIGVALWAAPEALRSRRCLALLLLPWYDRDQSAGADVIAPRKQPFLADAGELAQIEALHVSARLRVGHGVVEGARPREVEAPERRA